ncbi:MAG: hypothetical protein JRE18_08380 [Deltaproteobacteria bacterium]|jgi:hypothetical protein|nr:hypothetical protein [Deltaproteobacteria bacterium]
MALTDIDGQRLGDSVSDKLGDRNLIINGAMQVAQRGTSSTSVGLGTVDRWHSGGAGGTITQSQEDVSSSDSPYDEGFRKFFRQTNTAVASATSHYRQIETKLEAQDIANCGWNYTSTSSYVTVSAWLRSSVAGTYSYQLRTADGTAQSYVGTVTLTANTWTKVTQVYPGNTNLVFDNNNDLGLRVVWFPYLGSDYTTGSPTLNAWHAFSGSNMTSDDTAGWGTTAGATFDITGVQLEVGNTATPFQHESYGQTLAKCQRYYYKFRSSGELVNTARSAAGAVYWPVTVPTPMRISAPTIVGTTGLRTQSSVGGGGVTTNAWISASQFDTGKGELRFTSSITGSANTRLTVHEDANEIQLDAEI